MCHYIASTKIPKFWEKKSERENMNVTEGLEFVHSIQNKKEKQSAANLNRRPTIAHLSAYNKKGGKGKTLNLEKQWLDRLQDTGKFCTFVL